MLWGWPTRHFFSPPQAKRAGRYFEWLHNKPIWNSHTEHKSPQNEVLSEANCDKR